MSKAVVILGAGASSDFGVPTLQGIFKDKWARQYLKPDSFLAQKLDEIFWAPRGHTLNHQAYAAGAYACVPKPFRREALIATIESVRAGAMRQKPDSPSKGDGKV